MQTRDIVERFKSAQDSLVIQQSDFSLAAIYDMVSHEAIDIAPHYQRRDRWSPEKQSALIESFLLNVPVPPVYLSEDEYGQYSVIDGKQRITAVRDFLGGDLKLRSLKKFPELEGMKFADLPVQLQNALTVRPYIRVTTLLKQSNESLKYEVFLRLNTGGDTLKPQEIRNVAYSGPFNDLLFELSESPFLKDRLKINSEKSPSFRSMDDLEHVLRFFTIEERWENIGNVLSEEMDDFMARHRSSATNAMRRKFLRSLDACSIIWGTHAFHKPTENDGWRDQFISPLYDAQMIGANFLSDVEIQRVARRKAEVLRSTRDLFARNTAFVKSVTQSTNNPSAVKRRVVEIRDLLKSIAAR